MGYCNVNNKQCNGESLRCKKNPKDINPIYRDIGDIVDRPFFNKKCSHYIKEIKYSHYMKEIKRIEGIK